MKRIFFLCIVFSILSTGCRSDNIFVLTTPTPLFSSTESLSIISTLESVPTNTMVSYQINPSQGDVIATATESPSLDTNRNVQTQCLKILPTLSPQIISNGIVVLEDRVFTDNDSLKQDYLLNIQTGEILHINNDDEKGFDYIISPDRKSMAYNLLHFDVTGTVVQNQLIVASSAGKRLVSIPWEKGWIGLSGWLDNEWLVINISGLDPLEGELRKPAHLLAVNPFSNERKILSPEFPDIHTFDMFDWAGWSRTMYDPSLTRVVYLTEYDRFSYVLWDLENHQEITRLSARIPMLRYIPIPRWRSDGSEFVIEAWNPDDEKLELFRVSRDGKSEQLTHLYPDAALAQYNWSPDGQYLAGMLDTSLGEKPELTLVVLDIETKQIINYCLTVRYFQDVPNIENSWSDDPPLPIWSPDGTQLLIRNRTGVNEQNIIFVDIVRGIAIEIAEDMEPVGWMLAP